ncbi:MAG: polyphosphate polymerase domain-containing protein [Candidatus Thiodiazotropha sp. (ex Codakia rugifera)]|nr:polyphosphate polymerase domain-containing protein [Candidatus Thiodiazotropha sp. (ex Codakia rugifera)]
MQFKRFELKYYIHDIQAACLGSQLEHLLDLDHHGDPVEGYRVRSLYFDSINDECLYQKQSGFLHRKKIRLRTYGDSGTEMVKFEIKHKHGQFVNKESCAIEKKDAQQICMGDYGLLLDYDDPILNRIYSVFTTRAYTPKVIVEYIRYAYVMPELGIRITFDKNMRSNINHLDLFSTVHDSLPIVLEGKQVLEVKYNSYFPGYLKNILSTISTERMAISKYTLARRFHKQQKWEDN